MTNLMLQSETDFSSDELVEEETHIARKFYNSNLFQLFYTLNTTYFTRIMGIYVKKKK